MPPPAACLPILAASSYSHTAITLRTSMATSINLRTFDCTNPGRGQWKTILDVRNRAVLVRNTRSRFVHKVYYGTRTERTEEEALVQATAICALMNALKAKRP